MTPDKKRPATDGSPSPVRDSLHNTRQQAPAYQSSRGAVVSTATQVQAITLVHEKLMEAEEVIRRWRAGEIDAVFAGWELGRIGNKTTLAVLDARLESPQWDERRAA